MNAVGLDTALESAGDGACVVDPEGTIRLWNASAEQMLGYTAREATGRSCCEVFQGRDDDGNLLCHPACRVMTLLGLNESLQSFEMETRTKEGRPLWLSISVLAVPGDGGTTAIHLFRDVTATKDLLRHAHERLSAALPGKDPTAAPAAALSRRELEVLRLVATGASTRAVAERLRVSQATIRNHVQNILTKLGAHSRLEAVAHAMRHRLL